MKKKSALQATNSHSEIAPAGATTAGTRAATTEGHAGLNSEIASASATTGATATSACGSTAKTEVEPAWADLAAATSAAACTGTATPAVVPSQNAQENIGPHSEPARYGKQEDEDEDIASPAPAAAPAPFVAFASRQSARKADASSQLAGRCVAPKIRNSNTQWVRHRFDF